MRRSATHPGRYLLAGVLGLLVVGYFAAAGLLADGTAVKSFFRTYVHSALMVAAALLALRSAARSPRERGAWACMAVALTAYAAGEITWRFGYADDPSPPFPSWADGLWLLTYPAFYAGTMLLLRARIAALAPSAWLDGLIGAVVTVAAGLEFYAHPVLEATHGDPIAVGVTMAYPIGDVLLLALLAGVLAIAGGRLSRAWLLLALGQAAIALGDVFYALGTAKGTYVEGRWPDALWPLGVLLIAWAAQLPAPGRRPLRLEGFRALAVPSALIGEALTLEVAGELWQAPLGTQILTKVAFALVIVRISLTVRENLVLVAQARRQALCDELTGLGNRRRLLADLDALLDAETVSPHALTLFDLDGFKAYNDAFGHPAGDELLARLGGALGAAIDGHGRAYRLGGDEFCILTEGAAGPSVDAVVAAARTALTSDGEGFRVGASHGTALLPDEAPEATAALKLADERMYRHKARGRSSAASQSRSVLLGVLGEREPARHAQLADVAELARLTARRLGLGGEEIDEICRAAELRDIGKAAIPDAILDKPGPLTDAEWAFVRRHTVIGERILRRAPALYPVAALVRASHERWDGAGYPDGHAGHEIPLGARIVAVCDAFDALTAERPYRAARSRAIALDELRRCAGTRFDPRVVTAFAAALHEHDLAHRRSEPLAATTRSHRARLLP